MFLEFLCQYSCSLYIFWLSANLLCNIFYCDKSFALQVPEEETVPEANDSDGSVGGDIENDVEDHDETEEIEDTELNSSAEINQSIEPEVEVDDKKDVTMLEETNLLNLIEAEEEKTLAHDGEKLHL